MLPLIGRLADLLPRQRVLLGCLVVFVVGSVVTALRGRAAGAGAGRVLQGVGGGGLVPATLALVADLWPPRPPRHAARGRRRGAGARQRARAAARRGGPGRGRTGGRSSGSTSLLGAACWPWRSWLTGRRSRPRCRTGHARRTRAAAVLAVLASLSACSPCCAPERLVTGVTTGIPFIPLVGTSRVLTPIGVADPGPAGRARRRDRPRGGARAAPRPTPRGPLLVAVALGQPRAHLRLRRPGAGGRRPAAARPAAGRCCSPSALPPWQHRRAAAPARAARRRPRAGGRVRSSVSLLVGAALVAVVVDVPLLARLTATRTQTDGGPRPRPLPAGGAGRCARSVGGRCAGSATGRRGGRPALVLASAGLLVMSTWGTRLARRRWPATVVLVAVGLGIGLALAPVNAAALADAPAAAHGVAELAGRGGPDGRHGRGAGAADGGRAAPLLRRRWRGCPTPRHAGARRVPGWCRCRPSSPAPPSRQPSAAVVALRLGIRPQRRLGPRRR